MAKLAKRIRGAVTRLKLGIKSKKSIQYLGSLPIEEVFKQLSETIQNPNWISENYHIDHIWQVHWFNLTEENWENVCSICNNIRNLRVISGEENLLRSKYDFSILDEKDLCIYKPFLKPDILDKIILFLKRCKDSQGTGTHDSKGST